MKGYTEVCQANDITKETEKAIQIDYVRERYIWLPKSQIIIEEGVVWVKLWIAKQNGIGCYNQSKFVAG